MKPRIYIYVALVSALFFFSPLVKAQVDSGAMVVSAVEYIESGDYIRAEAVLQRILSEDPENDAALRGLEEAVERVRTLPKDEFISMMHDAARWYR